MKRLFSIIFCIIVLSQMNLLGRAAISFEMASIHDKGEQQAIISVSGITSSSLIQVRDEINVFRDHTTFQLLFFAQMETGVGLPVLTPFEKEIEVEDLSYGIYTIRCFALNSNLLDSTFFFSPDSSSFIFPSDSLEQPDSLFILADTTFVVDYSEQTTVAALRGSETTRYLLTFPNPFNAQTTFQFFVPTTQFVTLSIYDALGKKVATVVESELHQGPYAFPWDAAAFSSGIYFYKLRCGETSHIGRISLLK
ncbi:T9SS type A sorting domain-containing protein [candidate division KSB1 bacterium]|nr:T9SS type A sorting domain-containing protein [candidate division KSB1 bacterium]